MADRRDGREVPDAKWPPSTRRFVAAARAAGLEVEPFVFPEGTRTAVDAARALGCEVRAIVKSLVFTVDDEPVVVLMAGDRRVDTGKLASHIGGGKARRASLEAVRRHTGFAAGGTPPLGYPEPLRVLADRSLLASPTVYAAAGTPTTVFPTTPDALVAAAGAEWVDVAEAKSP